MSFCFLLNAVLLFASVVTFICAGFAGSFSRRLQGCRYRLMLAPLGFLVLGSLSYSTTTHLVAWFAAANPDLQMSHLANEGLGSGADIFESAMLLLAGFAGVLAGIALGGALDGVPSAEQMTAVNHAWDRQGGRSKTVAAATEKRAQKAKVIAITSNQKQAAALEDSVEASKALSENE